MTRLEKIILLPSCCTRRCPVCLSVSLSRSPSVHPFVCLSIHPFICLSVCLSVSLLSTHLPLSLWASTCMLFDRKKLRKCFITHLVSFSVSQEVLISRLGLISVKKILVSLMVSIHSNC